MPTVDFTMVMSIGLLAVMLGLLAGSAAIEAGCWWAWRGQPRDPFGRSEEPWPDLEWLRRNPALALAGLAIVKALLLVAVLGLVAASASGRAEHGLAVVILGAGLVVALVLVHLVPYSLVLRRGDRAARRLVGAARWLSFLLAPIASPLSLLSQWLIGPRPALAPEEEPESAAARADAAGIVEERHEEEGRQMLRGILELQKTAAREVMVPRVDMVAVEVGTPLDEVVSLIVSRGLSRIPLYEGTLDTIVGIIYAKDLLAALPGNAPPADLRSLARPASFIPETKRLGDLLREFRSSRVHLAIVVDEYGGTAGLVTIEDLLEEIVGEIEDEYDVQVPQALERISDHEVLVDARMSIDDFNELFALDLRAEAYDTVGGLVYTHLGRVPNPGDELRVNGLVVSVVATAGRRITRLKIDHAARSSSRSQDGPALPESPGP